MKMNYGKSVELALAKGYQEIADPHAYRGVCFVKDGLIWIHDIEALKNSLGLTSNEDLQKMNYDVEAYQKYKDYTNEMADKEMQMLYGNLCVEVGEPVYLMDGMYLFPDGSIGKL